MLCSQQEHRMRRIATIFDNRPRPETTGVYCRRALDELVQIGRVQAAEQLLPEELESIPADRFDAFLAIDDGLEYPIPSRLRPLAWWAIDTHMSFDRCLRRAKQADVTFAAQRNGAERLQRSGHRVGQLAAAGLRSAATRQAERRQAARRRLHRQPDRQPSASAC